MQLYGAFLSGLQWLNDVNRVKAPRTLHLETLCLCLTVKNKYPERKMLTASLKMLIVVPTFCSDGRRVEPLTDKRKQACLRAVLVWFVVYDRNK